MILLRRALAGGGQRRIALAQVTAHPRDEGDEQHRNQQEADEAALEIERQRIGGIGLRQDERRRIDAQRDHRNDRARHHGPRRTRREQDRAHHHLKQKQRGEGIGEAAAMVELPPQRRDIEQQHRRQLAVGDRMAAA